MLQWRKGGGWKVKKTVLKSALFTVCFYLSALIALLLDWNTNVLLCAIFCLAAMVYAHLAETEPNRVRFGWITVGFQIVRFPILLLIAALLRNGAILYMFWITEMYLDILIPLIILLTKIFLRNGNGKYK